MEDKKVINYYCFNKRCRSSIFSKNCVISSVLIASTIEAQFCLECYHELVSKEELNIKIQLGSILRQQKGLNSFIIDDDPIYHIVVKKLFEHSTTFEKPEHYMDGPKALFYLEQHQNTPRLIPDVIFIDVNMPQMDAWEFLQLFSALYPRLNKNIDVYVMTNLIEPMYKNNIDPYHFVKAVISKNFDLSFLNGLAV